MPEQKLQTFDNHARLDPPFHFFAAPIAFAAVVWTVMRLIRDFSIFNFESVAFALAFLVAVFLIRIYALRVQDRVIRLEETLRMERLLPSPLLSHIGGLTVGQIVALRFASDGELPGLIEQTLANRWKPKEIKKAIRIWRPDTHRV